MKNIAIITLLVLFLFSCKRDEMLPPTLTIKPEDSLLTISPIKPDTFQIKGFANEDLFNLEITTSPNVFYLDSVFPDFTHTLGYTAIISIGDQILSLPDDSIITVNFTLRDHYMYTEITKYLRVISGYGKIKTDSSTLSYGKDSTFFYSFEKDMLFNFNNISKNQFDLIFIDDTSGTNGFLFASPDAFYPSNKLTELGYSYDASDQNHTKMNGFATDFDAVDARFLYNLDVPEGYINDNQGLGAGHSNLKPGDIIAFELQSGKKGVLKVTQIDSANEKIHFIYKMQSDVVKRIK